MLRLAGDGTSSREIAQRLGIARSTVQDNLKRAEAVGLSWPLSGDLTDDALEDRLFARAGVRQGLRRLPEPNWADFASTTTQVIAKVAGFVGIRTTRPSTSSATSSSACSAGSRTGGGSQPVSIATSKTSSEPSLSPQPSSGGCNESSGNLWLLPSELKDGSHFWLSKLKEGSSHETLCRTGPVDGNHAGLHCR
jgi:hypothetical protein